MKVKSLTLMRRGPVLVCSCPSSRKEGRDSTAIQSLMEARYTFLLSSRFDVCARRKLTRRKLTPCRRDGRPPSAHWRSVSESEPDHHSDSPKRPLKMLVAVDLDDVLAQVSSDYVARCCR